MRDIFYYIESAKRNSGAKSDRKLSALLEQSPNVINFYRSGRSLPNDETMIKLARLANVPAWEALIDLQIWRSENQNVKSIWEKLRKTVVTGLTIAILTGSPAPAPFQNLSSDNAYTVYSGKWYILFIKLYQIIVKCKFDKAFTAA